MAASAARSVRQHTPGLGPEVTESDARATVRESPSLRSQAVRVGARYFTRPLLAILPASGPSRGLLRAVISSPAVLDLVPARRRASVRRAYVPAGEWVRPPGILPPLSRGVVLFLHGGGYVAGSPRAYRSALRLLATDAGLPVLALNYRRAPEHPIPAALEDAVEAYETLLGFGVPADRIHVVGDSAGAHLAVDLLAELTERDVPPPARMVFFSPVLAPESTQAVSRDRDQRDPVVSPRFVRRCIAAARGGNADLSTDALRRLDGVPDRRLPAVLTLLGAAECYIDDARRLHRRLDRAGVPNEYRIVVGQVHSFVTLARVLPEAREAVREAARFLACGEGTGPLR